MLGCAETAQWQPDVQDMSYSIQGRLARTTDPLASLCRSTRFDSLVASYGQLEAALSPGELMPIHGL